MPVQDAEPTGPYVRKLRRALGRITTPPQELPARDGVTIGEKCSIDPGVRFLESDRGDVVIGDLVTIYRDTEILGPVQIGKGTFINRSAYIRPGTTLGERVNVGPFARFISDTHEIGPAQRRAGKLYWAPIEIGDGAWIGAGATILGGVTVGAGAVVAAGAVVTADVPENALVGGVPARLIRDLATQDDQSDAARVSQARAS
ncbi:acyltransferase [Myceligenerans crystallogenes]|uniref:Transferase hexapeptide (Six repeat-containing protein) n=1 Tax=Myceligenerans crystallogenes TaxID=316335 RepID=A0ABN2N5D7_9MICO